MDRVDSGRFFWVCRVRFKCNFKLIGRKNLLTRLLNGILILYAFFSNVSSFRISRFTSKSYICGERALKDVGAHWCTQRDSYENVFDKLLKSRIRWKCWFKVFLCGNWGSEEFERLEYMDLVPEHQGLLEKSKSCFCTTLFNTHLDEITHSLQ